MFQSAIDAADDAAAGWGPERPDPAGGRQCCHLCLHRYRALVLDGPLAGLPHAVAHAVVVRIDEIIAARIEGAREDLEWSACLTLASDAQRSDELDRRFAEATGALRLAALEELAEARCRFDALRRAVEPPLAAYLDRHRMNEVPWQWDR